MCEFMWTENLLAQAFQGVQRLVRYVYIRTSCLANALLSIVTGEHCGLVPLCRDHLQKVDHGEDASSMLHLDGSLTFGW